jgi:hypothetical protein
MLFFDRKRTSSCRTIYNHFTCLRGIARKPRPVAAEACSIDVTDLTNIFTVGRPRKVRNNLKISAQTDEPYSRYSHSKRERVGYICGTF